MSLLTWALVKEIEANRIRELSNNFSQAIIYEEKAGHAMKEENYQKAWLYTLAALSQKIDTAKELPKSPGRLKRQCC